MYVTNAAYRSNAMSRMPVQSPAAAHNLVRVRK
jgi:hypothetical protein